MLVVSTQEVTFTEHVLRAMPRRKIKPQHIHLPSLHLMLGHQCHLPKLGDAAAISDPNEMFVPQVLVPFHEGPTPSS